MIALEGRLTANESDAVDRLLNDGLSVAKSLALLWQDCIDEALSRMSVLSPDSSAALVSYSQHCARLFSVAIRLCAEGLSDVALYLVRGIWDIASAISSRAGDFSADVGSPPGPQSRKNITELLKAGPLANDAGDWDSWASRETSKVHRLTHANDLHLFVMTSQEDKRVLVGLVLGPIINYTTNLVLGAYRVVTIDWKVDALLLRIQTMQDAARQWLTSVGDFLPEYRIGDPSLVEAGPA